jgi:1,6-anhydro-N-acetylmuramate kinase
MKPAGFYCLGLMSGTSMDGIDAVLAHISSQGDTTVQHTCTPYPKKLRQILFSAVQRPQLSLQEFGVLDHMLGEAFATAAVKCLQVAERKKKIRAKSCCPRARSCYDAGEGCDVYSAYHDPGQSICGGR